MIKINNLHDTSDLNNNKTTSRRNEFFKKKLFTDTNYRLTLIESATCPGEKVELAHYASKFTKPMTFFLSET